MPLGRWLGHGEYMKTWFGLILPVAASLAVSGCNEAKPKAKAIVAEIVPVQVITLQASNLVRTINAVGTIRYRQETPLGFTTAGKVATVRFDAGDYVKRGALLAALDTTDVGADLSVAEAERFRAESEFSRIKSLYADGWVTKARYEASEAAVKEAAARVSKAGFAKGTSQLYAPSSGVVITRNVQPGQIVAAGSPALILGEADEGFVFRVPIIDRDAATLRVGMAAEIALESLGGNPISAAITAIDGRANDATGAFNVQFRIAARPQIRSGQIGTVKINLPPANDGSVQIPASALFGIRTGEGLVYIVNADNIVETRNVVIGKVTDGFVMVTGGINPGDVIVAAGAEKLRNGVKVKPVTGGK